VAERTTDLPGVNGADLWRADALGELHGMLASTVQVDALLELIADRAAALVGPDVRAAITVRLDERYAVAAATDAAAAACDRAEQQAGSGPCLDASHLGRMLTVPDVAAASGWDEWRTATLTAGFGSAAAVPASPQAGPSLAINLYRPDPGPWDGEALGLVAQFADDAARAVVVAARFAEQARVNDDLKQAMSSRAVIDQALGVVMAQNRCGPEEAFGILRRASQHRNAKVRDVAAMIVAQVSGAAPHEVHEFRDAPGR
jgi:GAF domain-containing protein